MASLLGEGLAAAAAPVKGGLIRDALTSHYPRLAALLEDTFRQILQDTDVSHSMTAACMTLSIHCVCYDATHAQTENKVLWNPDWLFHVMLRVPSWIQKSLAGMLLTRHTVPTQSHVVFQHMHWHWSWCI